MSASETRRQIVDVADRLFYEHGFEATSFADIAQEVGLSRGNFYYHFKTKDEILSAVIARRMENTAGMLATWEHDHASPIDSIRSFARLLITNRTKIMNHGCPVGTLCNELSKLEHPAKKDATALFGLFRGWLSGQFSKLGRHENADQLALHLLMRSQGIATLATAFRDEAFIAREVADMEAWLAAECPTNSNPDRPRTS